jgi:ATP-binding cassette subfamily F protein 3
MLLRPSNTLLLDEPTNHLDLDSKEVLLDALVDYGGTLIFVSHDRYFVERLATKIVEVHDGKAVLYPGTYAEYLWSKENAARPAAPTPARERGTVAVPGNNATAPAAAKSYDEQKREAAERKRQERARSGLRARIADLENRIASHEKNIKDLEATMSAPGFYEAHEQVKPIIDRHQTLMWEVGELLNQWEMLQAEVEEKPSSKS